MNIFATFIPLLTFGSPLLVSAGAVLVETSVRSETSDSLLFAMDPS